MRLSKPERQAIKSAILSQDPKAKIYLYGSRTDDQKKGGDIDLLVFSEKLDLSLKISILASIKETLGEQKIDLKIINPKAQQDPFVTMVLPQAIEL